MEYLSRRRIKILELIWSGVNNIDELTCKMLSRKNVIIKALRALELHGIVKYGSKNVHIIKTPKNVALLIALNIAKPVDIVRAYRVHVEDYIKKLDSNAEVESLNVMLENNKVALELKVKGLSERYKDKIRDYIVSSLGVENVKITFINTS